MKTLLIALSILIVPAAQAQVGAPKRIYQCDSNTDPDFLRVNIIRAFGKTYAAFYEGTGDGDYYGEDMIEVRYVDTGADSTRRFVQVEGVKATYPGMKMERPTRRTRGAVITVPIYGGRTVVSAKVGPLGKNSQIYSGANRMLIDCQAVINTTGI